MKKLFLYFILISQFNVIFTTKVEFDIHKTKRVDNTVITYYCTKNVSIDFIKPFIIICQGSSSRPDSISPNKISSESLRVECINKLSKEYTIILIEKPGITETEINQKEFEQNYTVDERVSDLLKVITDVSQLYDKENKKGFILMGGSEGCAVISRAFPFVTNLQGLIFISGISKTSLDQLILNTLENQFSSWWYYPLLPLLPFLRWYLKREFNRAKSNPTTNKKVAGYTYKYWNSMFAYNHELFMKNIIETKCPICIIHGAKDFIPINECDEIFCELKDKYNKDINYLRYENLGHELNINVFRDIEKWLKNY